MPIMMIGYACINTSINCSSSRAFRLKNYSKERLVKTVNSNLNCLKRILEWNNDHGIKFFRVSSQLVPFASHPVCKFDWQDYFKKQFKEIGSYVKGNNLRLSMHPDQFVVINSNKPLVVERSINELIYHCEVLDLMGLDSTNKIVIHAGGVYGDKEGSIKRFKKIHSGLPSNLMKRLIVENDEKSYDVKDCLNLRLPVIVDTLHHKLNNNGEPIKEVIKLASGTWRKTDGRQIIHYSEQRPGASPGAHSQTISVKKFMNFYEKIKELDLNIMIEVKDKEQSVIKLLSSQTAPHKIAPL